MAKMLSFALFTALFYHYRMRSVKGNKTIELSVAEITEIARKYNKTHVDLGTGDGRFIYESALKDPHTLYVGIDPAEKQMREYSVKCVKKKLDNALFLVSSIENLPDDFSEIADVLTIILPWGSLLGGIVRGETVIIGKVAGIIKRGGEISIVLGYSAELEPSESERLELPELTPEYVENTIAKAFSARITNINGIEILDYSNDKLGNIGSNWAKKLTFGRDRKLYSLKILTEL